MAPNGIEPVGTLVFLAFLLAILGFTPRRERTKIEGRDVFNPPKAKLLEPGPDPEAWEGAFTHSYCGAQISVNVGHLGWYQDSLGYVPKAVCPHCGETIQPEIPPWVRRYIRQRDGVKG